MFLLRKNQAAWKWASKTLLTGASLFILLFWGGPFLIKFLLYLSAIFTVYLSQLEDKGRYKTSLLVLSVLGLLFSLLDLTNVEKIIIFGSFLALFFVIIGLINLMFSDEKSAYEILTAGISVLVGLLIFRNNLGLFPGFLLSFIVFWLIFRENLCIRLPKHKRVLFLNLYRVNYPKLRPNLYKIWNKEDKSLCFCQLRNEL